MKNEMQDMAKKRLEAHLLEFQKVCSYEWIGIFLFGSQIYGLEDQQSDVDSRIIYLGRPEEKPRELITKAQEHIEALTIYSFYDCLLQQSHQALELLFSPIFILNPKYQTWWDKLFAMKEQITKMNEKQWYSYFHYAAKITKARFDMNDTTDLDTLSRMGYPPKAAYHLLRMEEQLYKYSQGKDYSQVVQSDQKEFLIQVKRGKYSKKEAEEIIAAAYLNIQRTLSNIKPSKPDLQTQYKLYKLITELEI